MHIQHIQLRFPGYKTKALTFSYDDGVCFDRKAIEIFNKYGIKATFNLNSSRLGSTESFINPEEVKALYNGHEIAVHTYTHPFLQDITKPEVIAEYTEDRKYLESLTGNIVDGMAYPFGLSDANSEPELAALCGISYGRTVNSTHHFNLPNDFLRWNPTCHHDDGKMNELINQFLYPDDYSRYNLIRPKLFYIWGHTYEFNDNNNWDRLEDICQKLSSNDLVWYATNGEIFKYITAFRNLKKSYDGSIIYNPSGITVYCCANGENVKIEPNQTVRL